MFQCEKYRICSNVLILNINVVQLNLSGLIPFLSHIVPHHELTIMTLETLYLK
jgi:hypothetical protein